LTTITALLLPGWRRARKLRRENHKHFRAFLDAAALQLAVRRL
jgi:hypothetical protein